MTPAKCPNPSCPFLFDPSQVPPGAVIACPQCGMRFTLGPTPPPPMPLYGPAPPPPADDLGLLEEPANNTDDMPTEDRPRKRRRDEDDDRDRPAERRKRRDGGDDRDPDEPRHRAPPPVMGWKTIVFSLVGVLLVCGVIALVLLLKGKTDKTRNDQAVLTPKTEVKFDKYLVACVPPADGWATDEKLKKAFKANILAVARSQPTGWFVMDARPMAYTPNDIEMKEMVRDALGKSFDNLLDDLPAEDAELAGQKCKRYTFEAVYVATGDDVKGEAFAVGFQKHAYLFFSFAPNRDVAAAADQFAAVRGSVRFLAKGDAGTPAAGFSKAYRSQLGTYTLTATENVWAKKDDARAKDQDEKADMWIEGKIKLAGGGVKPGDATVLVLVLEKAGSEKATADAHLEKIFDLPGGKPTVKELGDDLQGDTPPSGEPMPAATVTRAEVRYENTGSESRKYLAYSTLEAGGKVIVAAGWCVLKDRRAWEKRLVQLVGSLAPPE